MENVGTETLETQPQVESNFGESGENTRKMSDVDQKSNIQMEIKDKIGKFIQGKAKRSIGSMVKKKSQIQQLNLQENEPIEKPVEVSIKTPVNDSGVNSPVEGAYLKIEQEMVVNEELVQSPLSNMGGEQSPITRESSALAGQKNLKKSN